MSLVSGWVPVGVPLTTVLALLVGVDWRSRPGRRGFAGAFVTAVVVAAGLWWAQVKWAVVPYDVAVATYVWIGLLVLTVCTPVTALSRYRSRRAGRARPSVETGRRRRRGLTAGGLRITLALVAVPLALASAAVGVNRQYGYYPTVASLRGDSALAGQSLDAFNRARRHHHHHGSTPDGAEADATGTTPLPVGATGTGTDTRSASSGRAGTDPDGRGAGHGGTGSRTPGTSVGGAPPRPHGQPAATLPAGSLVQLDLPGAVSGFSARAAWVWAPPLYVDGDVTQPPVVMLLAGSPGQTSDWLRGGNAAATAQAYADHHDGVAPMLVLPDANGSATGDTECVDSTRGRAETYLTRDVPTFLASTFGVATDHWAVAGLSEGGTCAAMLALRHPDLFTAFASFSGLTSPTLTEKVDRATTARDLFGGDVHAYDDHDPLWLLDHQPPRSVQGWWQVGADDVRSRTAQRTLAREATTAGMTVHAVETPGQGHDFTFWSAAFADALPALMAATGTRVGPDPGPTGAPRTVTSSAAPSSAAPTATSSPRGPVAAASGPSGISTHGRGRAT